MLIKQKKSIPKFTSKILNTYSSQPPQYKRKIIQWNWLHGEITRISNYKMWNLGPISVISWECLTCTLGMIHSKDAIEPYHTIFSCCKYGHTVPYNIPYMQVKYVYVRYLELLLSKYEVAWYQHFKTVVERVIWEANPYPSLQTTSSQQSLPQQTLISGCI